MINKYLKIQYQKYLNAPKNVQFWVKDLSKVALFCLIWFVSACLIIQSIPINYHEQPYQYFKACFIENEQPKLDTLINRNGLPLCDKNYSNIKHDVYEQRASASFDLTLIDSQTNEWEVYYSSGVALEVLGGPYVYRYRVKNDKVIPLWSTWGGSWRRLKASFYGFLIASMLYLIVADWVIRYVKKYIQDNFE